MFTHTNDENGANRILELICTAVKYVKSDFD